MNSSLEDAKLAFAEFAYSSSQHASWAKMFQVTTFEPAQTMIVDEEGLKSLMADKKASEACLIAMTKDS